MPASNIKHFPVSCIENDQWNMDENGARAANNLKRNQR